MSPKKTTQNGRAGEGIPTFLTQNTQQAGRKELARSLVSISSSGALTTVNPSVLSLNFDEDGSAGFLVLYCIIRENAVPRHRCRRRVYL